MRAGPEDGHPVAEEPTVDDQPAPDDGVEQRQHRMPPPPPPRPVQEKRKDPAAALPPPPYRAAPPPSTPFGDPGPVSSLPPVPSPQPRLQPPPAPLPAPPPPASRNRWVPAADDTQVMSSLPPVPRGPVDEREEEIEAREGAPGASRSILRAAGTMAVATLVSRVTGLIRTMVLAAALGVLLVNDAYNTANTLPNIVYELLLGGVLTSVVVPLLVHAQEHDRDGGVGYAQRLATIATAGLVVVTGLAILVAPLLTSLYGITDDPDQVRLANWLARILLIEIVFYGVGALAQAILNSRDVFGPPAWAPVLNNVIVIATGLLFIAASGPGDLEPATITPGQIWLLGIGTTLGIAVQALVLLPLLSKAGVPLRPRWGLRNTGLREAGTLGLWVIGYVAVSQIGVIVATRIANAAAREGGLGSSAFAVREPAVPDALRDHRRRPADRAGAPDEPGRLAARHPRAWSPTSPSARGCPRWACSRSPPRSSSSAPAGASLFFARGNTVGGRGRGHRHRARRRRLRAAAAGGHPAAAARLLRHEGRPHADAHPGRHGRRPRAAAAARPGARSSPDTWSPA